MRIPIAFVDANVLYPKTLRDWLFLLRIETGGGMFSLVSSEDVLTESLYHLRKKSPEKPGEYTGQIQASIRKCLDDVLNAFPAVDFPGADENDRHVHSAATASNASYLIANDKGFQAIDADALPYEVHTADSFFMLVAANAPDAVDRVITRQLAHFSSHGVDAKLVERLVKSGCPQFAECVKQHLQKLAKGEASHGITDGVPETSRIG